MIPDRDCPLQFCLNLGIVINLEKSNLVPSQRTLYLGMLIDSRFESLSFRSENRKVQDGHEVILVETETTCVPVASRSRSPVIFREARPSRPASPLLFTAVVERLLVFCIPLSQEVRQDLAWWLHNRKLTIGMPRDPSFLGRLDRRVGGSYRRSFDLRILEPERKASSHQCHRTESSLFSPSGASRSGSRSLRGCDVRQHHGGSLHKQMGVVSHHLHNLTVQLHQWEINH